MHSEHLQNVGVGRVAAGWLVALAVASLAAFVFIGLDVLTEETSAANTFWSVAAVAVGFFAGGFFAGFRALEAPILHAAGMGLMSLVAWFILNAVAAAFFPDWGWPSLTPQLALGLLLAQFVAATLGALLGYNLALRGRPGLTEHEPLEG